MHATIGCAAFYREWREWERRKQQGAGDPGAWAEEGGERAAAMLDLGLGFAEEGILDRIANLPETTEVGSGLIPTVSGCNV
jgi:hypothetical protein